MNRDTGLRSVFVGGSRVGTGVDDEGSRLGVDGEAKGLAGTLPSVPGGIVGQMLARVGRPRYHTLLDGREGVPQSMHLVQPTGSVPPPCTTARCCRRSDDARKRASERATLSDRPRGCQACCPRTT